MGCHGVSRRVPHTLAARVLPVPPCRLASSASRALLPSLTCLRVHVPESDLPAMPEDMDAGLWHRILADAWAAETARAAAAHTEPSMWRVWWATGRRSLTISSCLSLVCPQGRDVVRVSALTCLRSACSLNSL